MEPKPPVRKRLAARRPQSREYDLALQELSEPFRGRVPDIAVDGFPTATDLATLAGLIGTLPSLTEARDGLQRQVRARDRTLEDIRTHESAVAALGEPADMTAARAELETLKQAVSDLERQRGEESAAQTNAEEAEKRFSTQLIEAQTQLNGLNQKVGGAESTLSLVAERCSEALGSMPPGWADAASQQSDETRAALTDELALLEGEGVEDSLAALAQDRAVQVERERQAKELEQRIEALPAAARRPSSEVDAELTLATEKVSDRRTVRCDTRARG